MGNLLRFKTSFERGTMQVSKIKKKINFPFRLVIPKDIYSPKSGKISREYELFAVMNHVGEESTSGHYTADVRSSPTAFLRTDDTLVEPVRSADSLSTATTLFYLRK